MKISIIIPVYNTNQYLGRCLTSIINQTYKDIEIICINDGSTDDSLKTLYGYAASDCRIKVISQENQGLVSARKVGVKVATGEYIGFVDSDDYVEEDMYECLINHAQKGNVDLVTCGYFLNGNYVTVHQDLLEEGFYTDKEILYVRENTIYKLEDRETGIRGSLCCKLFRASLLKKVQEEIPNTISIAEDKVCLLRYILECSSVYILKKPLYHWVIRGNSMSRASITKKNNYLVKVNEVYSYITTLFDHPNFTDIMRTQAEIYIIELLFLGINKRMGFKNTNMIWIDPYWMDKIPEYANIVLYGGGELGEKYKKQLTHSREDVKLVGCVDPQYEKLSNEYLRVSAPSELVHWEYDYIVITIKNKGKALAIKEELIATGILEDKIIWCEQPEGYWKYIEAEGLG